MKLLKNLHSLHDELPFERIRRRRPRGQLALQLRGCRRRLLRIIGYEEFGSEGGAFSFADLAFRDGIGLAELWLGDNKGSMECASLKIAFRDCMKCASFSTLSPSVPPPPPPSTSATPLTFSLQKSTVLNSTNPLGPATRPTLTPPIENRHIINHLKNFLNQDPHFDCFNLTLTLPSISSIFIGEAKPPQDAREETHEGQQ
uniref:Uncharacterized protein n=1 Tax=Fagus sylvatica TaxID=28930 RepID=A0A2N9IWS7_FAGSY